MIRIISILVFFILFVSIRQINGQSDCVPKAVEGVEMSNNGSLVWEFPADICTIDHFIVTVQYNYGGAIEETLITRVTHVDFSYLLVCEYWIFTITPVTANLVRGDSRYLFAKIPLLPDTDLSLTITDVHDQGDTLVLQWEVTNSSNSRCIDSYRVTIIEEDTLEIEDTLVLNTRAYIRNLAACSRYEFGVRAIHAAIPEFEGPLSFIRHLEPPRSPLAPRLSNISQGSRFFTSTWLLPDFFTNRCRLIQANINGSPYFNLTIPVEDIERQIFTANVTNLQPRTSYVFNVTVENIRGISPPVRMAVQTLSVGDEVEAH